VNALSAESGSLWAEEVGRATRARAGPWTGKRACPARLADGLSCDAESTSGTGRALRAALRAKTTSGALGAAWCNGKRRRGVGHRSRCWRQRHRNDQICNWGRGGTWWSRGINQVALDRARGYVENRLPEFTHPWRAFDSWARAGTAHFWAGTKANAAVFHVWSVALGEAPRARAVLKFAVVLKAVAPPHALL
jgi:hypothetical protein